MLGELFGVVGVDTLVDGFVADAGLSVALRWPQIFSGLHNSASLAWRPSMGTNAAAALTGPHAGL